MVGRPCCETIDHIDNEGKKLCDEVCPLIDSMNDRNGREMELYMTHKMGHRVSISVRTTPLMDDAGKITGGTQLFSDISDIEATRLRLRELEELALLDPLTQLANRNYIERELISRIDEKRRFDMPFGILFIDIDHFKSVNDTYGHVVGDSVLCHVAGLFNSCCRRFDLYGRWGGEEFVGIIRNITPENLYSLADRLRCKVQNSPVKQGGRKLRVTVSVGATIITGTDDSARIISRADYLMYQSKSRGRNCITMG
jgi:diguanylate cyclase (GGDEF)-like protein